MISRLGRQAGDKNFKKELKYNSNIQILKDFDDKKIKVLLRGMNFSFSSFFPAYNEAKNLESLVKKADAIFQKYFSDYEIIIIDDGSTDKTAEILKKLQPKFPKLKIISHSKNLGYGAALKSGFLAARKDLIFFSDADNQFDLSEIGKFLPAIEDYDAIIGFRKERRDNWLRRLNTWLWGKLIRFLFKIDFKDIDCAFKLFRREILQKIDLENLQSQGAVISTEILVKLKKVGAKIKELPVNHFPRIKGRASGASLKVIFRAFWELIKLYFNLKRNLI